MASAGDRAEGMRYMPEGLGLRGILVGALSIASAIAFALVAAFAVVHLGVRQPPELSAGFRQPPAIEGSARLQPDPARDIDAFMEEKRRLLEGYGWVDADHKIARIPIERAMALLAEQASGAKR